MLGGVWKLNTGLLRVRKAWIIEVYKSAHAHSYFRKIGQSIPLKVARGMLLSVSGSRSTFILVEPSLRSAEWLGASPHAECTERSGNE